VPGALGPPLPLSQIKGGRRAVPHLVVTSVGDIPMLRYKIGRAPAWLRRVVLQRQKWDLRSQREAQEAAALRMMAESEDEWEDILGEWVREEVRRGRQGVDVREFSGGGNSVGDGSENHVMKRLGEVDEQAGGVQDRYTYWPVQTRQTNHAAYEARKWEYGVRGWRLWQKVKREKWLSERETLPERVAAAITEGQRLQNDLVHESEHMCVALRGPLRSHEDCKDMRDELMAIGSLEIPVELSEKVVDKDPPRYLQDEANVRGIIIRTCGG
jgi:hypothetical protein